MDEDQAGDAESTPRSDSGETAGEQPPPKGRAAEHHSAVDQVVEKIQEWAPIVGERLQQGASAVEHKVREVAPGVGEKVQDAALAVAKKVQELTPVVVKEVRAGAARAGEALGSRQQRRHGGQTNQSTDPGHAAEPEHTDDAEPGPSHHEPSSGV
jgi:hypothetical protein